MADPVGAGAGIVGVIGLAIQLTQVVVQFGMDWKNAPDDVKTFMAELGTLKTVLSETNTNILLNSDFEAAFQNRPSVLLSQLGPNAPATTDTKHLLGVCQKELESLLKELKKRGESHQLGWGRFKSAFLAKDTRDSVENLCRQCQLLNSMLSIDAAVLGATTYKEVKEARKEQQEWHQAEEKISMAIRGGLDESNWLQENQLRQRKEQAILEWLTPIDYSSQQSDSISRRQPGTGQWLVDSAEFQTWLTTGKQTLFCPGIPGSGKTILTSTVIENLITQFRHDKNIGIAYLYCNFKRRDEQNIYDLLANLLKQLAQALDPLPDFLKSLYDKHRRKHTRLSSDEVLQALESVATLYTKVFIVVDALDECLATGNHRLDFISRIFDFQEKSGSNLFMTSRHLPEITELFRGHVSLEIRALESDVRKYVDSYMLNLPSFVGRSLDLQEEIKTRIVEAVDGMFLLAQLHLNSLLGKRSPKAVRAALKSLPSGSSAYDDAYKDTMVRIEGQLLDQKDLAQQVLSWITCAKRPLNMSELQHALAVELGESTLDEDNLPQIEDMVSVCAGLVTVDEESEIIRLVHYTTQEYFERTRETWFPNLETEAAKICVTYLSFDTFESGACLSEEAFEERLRSNQLYNYASCNWGHHAREAITSIPEVHSFLHKNAQVQASIQELLVNKKLYGSQLRSSTDFFWEMAGLHLAAYFGLEETVQHLLRTNIPDEKDACGRTPLSWAVENGHEAVVKLLLMNKAEVNQKDTQYGQTPLSWAASNGHEAVVKLLLANDVEVNFQDMTGETPLSRAASRGQEAILKLLLENGADIDLMDEDSKSPLSHAAESGHEDIVKLLLVNNADTNSKDNWGKTPLFRAAANGHGAIARLLLFSNVDIDLQDIDGRTALSYGAEGGHEAVVKLLLEYNAKVDLEDIHGRTALSYAAYDYRHELESGNEAVGKLLIAYNAKVNVEDNSGRTALSYAAESESEAMVKLLLANNAEVNVEDNDELTPLLHAINYECEAVAMLLLEHHAKIDPKDTTHDQMSISWAALQEDETVIHKLEGHRPTQCASS
ncbi:hypothetical protein V494_02746 [Pseudogymnoascus sp. VKM F-4513 (FW-928)]|nr:hypothetical protein V494_02746 [Pseudogymnoascus sp. VKM F-4513 (FW-928)]